MRDLHGGGAAYGQGGGARRLEVAPNLWASVGLVHGGAAAYRHRGPVDAYALRFRGPVSVRMQAGG